MEELLNEARVKMLKALEVLRADLATIRSGRATPSLVENIEVLAYGGAQKMKVVELGTVGTLDPHTLAVTPWDQSIIGELAKGIMAANVGLNPIVDGGVVRISVPSMTEERRVELVRVAKQKLEGGRIMVRQVRHESMADLKKFEAAGDISEDERVRLEKELQLLTDEMMAEIDSLGKKKEEELMEI